MDTPPENAITKLFNELPDTELYEAESGPGTIKGNEGEVFRPHLEEFLRTVLQQGASRAYQDARDDPDFEFTFVCAKRAVAAGCKCDTIFLIALGLLAHSSGPEHETLLDGSKRSQYLKYAAWVAHGRRDYENPFVQQTAATAPSGPDQFATLPMVEAPADRACAHCGKRSEDMTRCEKCFVEEGCALGVFFCNSECEQAHRDTDKDRAHCYHHISRAVSIVKSLSILLETATSYIRLREIRSHDGIDPIKVFALDGGPSKIRDPKVFYGDFIFPDPPCEMIRERIGEQAAWDHYLALVYFDRSAHVMVDGSQFIDLFLRPFCKSIKEVLITPKNAPITMTQVLEDGNCISNAFGNHNLLRVKGYSGEEFAVDLAGAQFGWKDSFSLWSHFEAHRAHSIVATCEDGHMEKLLRNQSLQSGKGVSVSEAAQEIRTKVVTVMMSRIKSWLKTHNMENTKDLLCLSHDEFATLKEDLLKQAKAACDGIIEIFKKKGIYRLYFLDDFQIRVAMTSEAAEGYKSIWLPERQVELLRDDQQKLRANWLINIKLAQMLME